MTKGSALVGAPRGMTIEGEWPTRLRDCNLSKGAIEVLRLYDSDSHTLHEYVLASRKSWETAQEATAYGIQLAAENDLTFKHDQHLDPESYRESMYLD